jgi:hypothetical protein
MNKTTFRRSRLRPDSEARSVFLFKCYQRRGRGKPGLAAEPARRDSLIKKFAIDADENIVIYPTSDG